MFRVATYNLLASRESQPDRFPRSSPEDLAPAHRAPRILAQLERFLAKHTVICLQELDDFWTARIHEWLPEGARLVTWNATGMILPQAVRLARCLLMNVDDPSGYAARGALVVAELEVRVSGFRFAVATTQIPGLASLAKHCMAIAQEFAYQSPLVFAADLQSRDVLAALTRRDPRIKPMDNVLAPGRTIEIPDVILSDPRLTLTDADIEPLSADTVLPGPMHPSHHIPLWAEFHLLTNEPWGLHLVGV